MRTTVKARSIRQFIVALGLILPLSAGFTCAGQSLPIIPGAHGFGMDMPAGSGRHLDEPETRVIKVTNLNTKGPGSLRAALASASP